MLKHRQDIEMQVMQSVLFSKTNVEEDRNLSASFLFQEFSLTICFTHSMRIGISKSTTWHILRKDLGVQSYKPVFDPKTEVTGPS